MKISTFEAKQELDIYLTSQNHNDVSSKNNQFVSYVVF